MEKNITYEVASPTDYDEIVEHGNFVFSYAHCPHEFKTLIPKAYGEERTLWPEHFLARENGRIRGMVGLLPMEQRVCGEVLRMGYIGTVCVHPYSRGLGHMKKCMALSTGYARRQGLDLLALGGQRQRYEHYGYEPGGVAYTFDLSRINCRQASEDAALTFAPFETLRDRMTELHAIYESGPVAGARPLGSFEQICRTWQSQPFALLRGDCLTGYVIVSPDKRQISELRLVDAADFTTVIKAYLARFDQSSVSIRIPAYRTEDVRAAASLCERCHISPSEMFLILNYERVVRAGLRLRQHMEGCLPDGRIALGISGLADEIRTLLISVSGGEIDCRFAEVPPDLVLDPIRAQNLLLAPVTCVDLRTLPDCARRFFPLPLYIESVDGF